MKYNRHSLLSLEAIDYQKNDWFIPEMNLLTEKHQKGELDAFQWGKEFSKLVKKRFNFTCRVEIEENDADNAAYWGVYIDDNNPIDGYQALARDFIEIVKIQAKPHVTRIAKGDLSPLGLLDHKKVRVGGLFSQMMVKFTITTGYFKLSPMEVTATMLHEIGHAWTFFEYIGTQCFRNAIIANNVKEYLSVKEVDQRTKILVAQSNVWGIQVDAEKLAKVNDENATHVIVGAYNKLFTEDVGYVQYNNNTAEAIADQFMARFGLARHLVKNLSKGSVEKEYAKFSNTRFIMSGVKIVANVATFFLITTGSPAMVLGLATEIILSRIFDYSIFDIIKEPMKAKFINGFTYDERRDRFKRVYNETIGYLKDNSLPHDIVKEALNDLEYMKDMIENQKRIKSIPMSIIRWLSSEFRSQESKKLYQQMIEDLLSNELYVTAARLRDLK